MTFHEALKKLEASGEYKNFKEKNKKAFLFSAFFILSDKIEVQQFNYYTPETQEAMTFMLEETIKHKSEKFAKKEVQPIDLDIKIDLDKLQDIIKTETEKLKLKVEKNIVILQKAKIGLRAGQEQESGEIHQEVQIWNVTCLCGFQMLRMQIDCKNGEIFKSEKSNLLDMVQVKK